MQIIYIPNSYLLWLLIHTANSVWVAGPFKDFRRIFRNLPQYRMLRFFSTSLQAQYCYQNILLYNFTYIILKYIIIKMLLYYTNYFFCNFFQHFVLLYLLLYLLIFLFVFYKKWFYYIFFVIFCIIFVLPVCIKHCAKWGFDKLWHRWEALHIKIPAEFKY